MKKRRLVMEGLERRQLLAAEVFLPAVDMPELTGPRNVGAAQSFTFNESEQPGELGENDNLFGADFIPLGTGPGQQDTIDITGTLPITAFPNDPLSFRADLDTYAFTLKRGDILDIAVQGAAGTIDVDYEDGTLWFATDIDQGGPGAYPPDSPLQTIGNAIAARVVPEDGTYYLTVSPIDTTSTYQVGLRTYRPIVEELPIGSQQVIFLDLDGGRYSPNNFTDFSGLPLPGVIRVPSLRESLPLLGVEELNDAAFNRLVDLTVAEVERQFAFLGTNGNAGDYDRTGNPGDYGVMILNSRDHADPGFHPLVTRVLIGGPASNGGFPAGLFGISPTLDVGNFSMDDIVLTVLDSILPTGVPMSPAVSELDAASDLIALTISHELGHSFGLRHTERANTVVSIIDANVDNFQDLGAGPDLIYGTIDDVNVDFVDDRFSIAEGYIGVHRVLDGLANTLITGTAGVAINGRVFSDVNRDGIGVSDSGLSGVFVFADINGNGIFEPSEPSSTSGANGNFTLSVRPGTFNVIAVTPDEFAPTTPTTVSATPGVAVNFGFNQVIANITGTVFVDNDGDGVRSATDSGLPGVFVYIDLDGDNRPDLGEPNTDSGPDGSYVLNFPGPGTFTIRDVVPAGFEQSFPASGEHTVTFDGFSLGDNFNFGLLPSQDFGDAPDSYGTTLLTDGARHGITGGLNIGATIDREVDGQPSAGATGDDFDAQGDDEDGVRLLSPLGPGATATFELTATNTTGAPAFIQAFMDFDGDGTFAGPGEQFVSDVVVSTGTLGGIFPLTVAVPAGTAPGTTFARFRLSGTSGLGATGFATSGEVEDYSFPILAAAEIANADEFSVSRNTLSNPLDVLANDFQTVDNQLTIESLNVSGTAGVVVIAGDQKSLFYTPPNGFIGRDVFSYTVRDEFGNRSTASVVVNVTFQSNQPIAIDDTFEVSEGSVNRALNVLDNDVPSTFGGLSITSVTAGSAGGTLSIVGGGQSIRYTPFPGFNGTEQFTYSVQDDVGSTSSATVTINLLPGSRNDDVVEFTIGVFDAVNINTPVTNVQVGDDVLVRVSVDDIRLFANPEGVASAFIDLLYTDELIATLNTDNNPDFPFDITFGSLFTGINVLQRGDSTIPGLIDEVGGVQQIDGQQSHSGPVELFTLRMRAVSPGVAVFQADPADMDVSETIVLASDTALTPSQLRLGRAELLILPASDNFTSAIDDSFPEGRDSNGALITNASAGRNRLNVLGNDNLGPTGTIREFGLVTAPSLGNVLIDDNGTPDFLNDDFLSYRANANVNGLERFSYVIVTDDNIRSTAEVTIALGNLNANADVAFDFNLVNSAGASISSVSVGQRFGVQVIADDLRFNPTFVFAGFLDVMYSAGIIQPSNTNLGDNFDFDVEFGPGYLSDPDVATTAVKSGIIDEFGTLFATIPASSTGLDPGLLGTIFFEAVSAGTATVVGGPADASPFSDTLVFQDDNPVDISSIRYDSLTISVGGGAPLQNVTLRQDVNNDGLVSPIDALLIINEMSRVAPEGEQAEGESVSRYFTDVNGDLITSAIDALQVINYLNRTSNAKLLVAGESVQAASNTSSGSDQVFADLADPPNKVVATDVSGQQVGSRVQIVGSDHADADDEDDVLDLLADDVSELWS